MMLEHSEVSGYACDGRGCTAKIEGPRLPHFEGLSHYQALAEAAGWAFWSGSRSRKAFCPDHGPSRGSRMERIRPVSPQP